MLLRTHLLKSFLIFGGAAFGVICAALGLWVFPVFGQIFWVFLFFSSLFLAFGGVIAFWLGNLKFTLFSEEALSLEAGSIAFGEHTVLTDHDGRILFASSSYRALVVKAGYHHLVNPETLCAEFEEASDCLYRLSQGLSEGKAGCEEFRLPYAIGGSNAGKKIPVWMRVEGVPFFQDRQKGALWRLKDITHERVFEEQAFGRLQRIITTLDQAPVGFFSACGQGNILHMNATLATWLGVELEVVGKGGVSLFTLFGKKGVQLLLEAPARSKKATVDLWDLELYCEKKKQTLPVYVINRVDFDAAGQMCPSHSIVIERALFERFYCPSHGLEAEKLVLDAPLGIAQINKEGVVLKSNRAFFDLCPVARQGAKIQDFMETTSGTSLLDEVARAWGECPPADRSQRLAPIDVVLRGQDVRTGRVFCDYAQRSDQESLAIYILDTTQHSSLEVQLSQSRKMLAIGQLAGGIAHDFNNVLTAIIGFSDLLLARHKPTDPSFADIMNIKQNANRAANLVRQLLAFSRRQTLRPEVTFLPDIISDLAHLLGRLLGEKITLEVVHGRDIGSVKLDINQFEQVIINLCVNARDAMPDGGVLRICTDNLDQKASEVVKPGLMPPGEYVVCEVSDTGMGMAQDVLEKIFEPFFTTKEVGKGTGLGLSTVYGIVKQTGGFIFCESEKGKGTTFRIYLPRSYERVVVQQEDKKSVTKSQDLTGKGTILLVEDEDAVRAFASRALQSRGYKVLTAETGTRALEIFEANKESIHLVLSDVVMPEMDGPTLLKELRKRGIGIKVIFISGYAEDAFEKNLENQEDFTFLPKPFTLKQLAETVKQAMG